MSDIKITTVRKNMTRRRPCTVCGGQTYKSNSCFAFIDPADGVEEFVCANCTADRHDIPEKLLRHADYLRRYADDLCKLAEYDFVPGETVSENFE